MMRLNARSKPLRLGKPVSASMAASEANRLRSPITTPTPTVAPEATRPDHHGDPGRNAIVTVQQVTANITWAAASEVVAPL
jgi:hypothetical protein